MSRRFSTNSVNLSFTTNSQLSQFNSKDLTLQNIMLKSNLRKTSLNFHLPSLRYLSNETLCENDEHFLKAYSQAKRKSVVISSALDDDVRNCIRNSLKNGKCVPGIIHESLNPLLSKIEEYEVQQSSRQSKKSRKKRSSSINNLTSYYKPRFGSLLSKEGQYALLKSYEDMIANELQSLYPELKNRIQRTRTANLKDKKQRHLSNSSDSGSHKSCDSTKTTETVSSKGNRNFCSSPINAFSSNRLREPLTNSTSFFDFNDCDPVDFEKKLKISQKLDNAMEIIDNLKLIKASRMLNSSIQNKNIMSNNDPLMRYNEWRNEWTELIEFN